MGKLTTSRITPEMTAALRQPQVATIQPTNGTSGPEIPGPMRKIPTAKLRRSRKV
jgi:hypothetical protein